MIDGIERRDFLLMASLAAAFRPARPRSRSPLDDRIDRIAAARHVEDGGVPRARRRARHLQGRPEHAPRIRRHERRRPQPITPDTIFTVASISKTVTATAMMKLVEQGRVELKAPVQKYLPDFRVAGRRRQPRRCTSGICSRTRRGGRGSSRPRTAASTRSRISRRPSCATCRSLRAPGAVWSYNNAGFALAGRRRSKSSPARTSTTRCATWSSRRSGMSRDVHAAAGRDHVSPRRSAIASRAAGRRSSGRFRRRRAHRRRRDDERSRTC